MCQQLPIIDPGHFEDAFVSSFPVGRLMPNMPAHNRFWAIQPMLLGIKERLNMMTSGDTGMYYESLKKIEGLVELAGTSNNRR